jgi:hypothetical protein
MADPEWITLPEVNVGTVRPRRRRRPPVVRGIDEPETPPATELAPELSDLDRTADRIRERVGIAPRTPAPVPDAEPRVVGIDTPVELPADDDEMAQRSRIDDGLRDLRNTRGPLAVQRVQAIDLPGAEDSPESTEAILGAIGNEQRALQAIPNTQLRAPQVRPPAATPPRMTERLRYPTVVGIDDEEEAPTPEQSVPRTDATAARTGAAPVERPARPIPGVQQEDPRDVADRTQALRMNIAQGALGIAGGLASLISNSRTGRYQDGPIDIHAATGVDRPRWSEAPEARIAQRAQQRAADQELAFEMDDRQFRRENEARRADLDARRIAQAEAATAEHARRTSAEFDVDSQDANGLREVYDATINSLPEEAQRVLGGWVDLDTTGYNARSMAAVLDQLNSAVDTARASNPRAFRQGQRSGGRRRSGGRLGGATGGGRGQNYGYGVQSREGGAPISPEEQATIDAQGGAPMAGQSPARPMRATGGSVGGGMPRQPAAQRPTAMQQTGIDLHLRAPTDQEIAANPELAYQEYLVQGAARMMGVDVNTPQGRAAAATAADRGLGEGAEDQLVMRGAGSRERTPEQQRQVEQFRQHYAPVVQREERLRQLGASLDRVARGPNGDMIIRAALHANSGVPAAVASSPEVTNLRAQIYDHLNEYFSTFGGANVTENELMRYYSAFGAGTWTAAPSEFLRAISRQRRQAQGQLDQGAAAFPDGAELFFNELEANR